MMKEMDIPSSSLEQQALKNFIENEEAKTRILKDDNLGWKFWKKRRYIIGILSFFAFFVSYIFQIDLYIAIGQINRPTNDVKNGYKWDPTTQRYIMSSFYLGYICTQIIGGWMSNIIGGKKIIGCSITVATILTILTPIATKYSVYLLITVRITMGFFLGMAYPAIQTIWANWAPKFERTRLISLTLSGSPTGAIFGMTIAGLIASYVNWQWVFYIFGILGIIWSIFWWLIVKDKPEDDLKITKSELDFINQSLDKDYQKKTVSHPWKAIITSPAYWAIIIAYLCGNRQFPILMTFVYHNNLSTTGIQLANLYFCLIITTIFAGNLADYLISNNYLSITKVRKIFTCGAFIVQAIFIVSAGFVSSSNLMVIFIIAGIGIGAFMSVSLTVNFLDIAPQHASVLLGVASTISTAAEIMSPMLIRLIVKDPGNIEQWRIMFIIGGIISIAGCIVYGIFGSGNVQKWAEITNKNKVNEDYEKEKIKIAETTQF